MAVATATSLGFVAGVIKALADGKERSLKVTLGAILGGGLFAGTVSCALIYWMDLDPLLVAFVAGILGAAGDHIIVAISSLAEPWRTKPKDALKDVQDLIQGKGDNNHE